MRTDWVGWMGGARLRTHTGTSGNGHANVGVDQGLAARGDDRLAGRVEVVAGGEGAAAGGQAGLV